MYTLNPYWFSHKTHMKDNLNRHSKVTYQTITHERREGTHSPNQLQGQWQDHEKARAYDQFLTTAQNPLQSFYQPITFNYRYEAGALNRA